MSFNLAPGLATAPVIEPSEEALLLAPHSSSELPEGAKIHDVIIMGSGPASYTATICTARAGLDPLVLAGAASTGSALMNTTEVENFPSFLKGVQRPELTDKTREQAEKFSAEIRYKDVTAVNLSGDVRVLTLDGEFLYARSVISATSSEYHHISVEDKDRLSGRGVSYCATCDDFFFKDKALAVIDRDNSTMEEASFLTNFASKVIVVHHRSALRASKSMADRAMANPGIKFERNAVVDEVLGDEAVRGLRLWSTVGESTREIGVDDVFIMVSHLPCTGFLAEDMALDEAGYITVEELSARTSAEDVFACGDAIDHGYRQVITAAGSGCRAALDAERQLVALND